ncbi:hypothetical protein HYX17_02570 [Candidatus Woesearchaeota archaeon]|nr:hypothetical protein [Candidatus Woesearchaeota archaeon]
MKRRNEEYITNKTISELINENICPSCECRLILDGKYCKNCGWTHKYGEYIISLYNEEDN